MTILDKASLVMLVVTALSAVVASLFVKDEPGAPTRLVNGTYLFCCLKCNRSIYVQAGEPHRSHCRKCVREMAA